MLQQRSTKSLLLALCVIVGVLYCSGNGPFLSYETRPNAPLSFDCAARSLAYEFAQKLQPKNPSAYKEVFDALQLKTLCNQEFVDASPKRYQELNQERYVEWKEKYNRLSAFPTFYVDPVKGSDNNDGSLQRPFLTIGRGVFATRAISSTTPRTIFLRAGTFYLNETILLTSVDSNLTITAYNSEQVYISGGVLLKNLQWKPYKVAKSNNYQLYPGGNNVYGRAVSGGNTPTIRFLGLQDNVQQCANACTVYSQKNPGAPCRSFTFHGPELTNGYAKQCFAAIDSTWGPTYQQYVTSGKINNLNVYSADVSRFIPNDFEFLGLQQVNGGGRYTRARYPDANVETGFFPSGFVVTAPVAWKPAKTYPPALSLIVEHPIRHDINEFRHYTMGFNGSCVIFTPPENYWCSQYSSGGAGGYFETPQGLTWDPNTFTFAPPLDNNGGLPDSDTVVHVFHPYHWSMWMYKLDSINLKNRQLEWSFGGFQGSRGAISGNGRGGEWYLDNVFSQLDTPDEWYYNKQQKTLYLYYNSTNPGTPPPANFETVATGLDILIKVSGNQNNPVQNLELSGINFVGTGYTYLAPHGVPSGGDWAMQYSGAVSMEGTTSALVKNCTFNRLDGNGMFIWGYNRGLKIVDNHFSWIGDSCVVSWGITEGIDGTLGDQPRGTLLQNNVFRDFGQFEKQASAWFQAKSMETRIENNLMFNNPRALINFNDGFGGGNVVARNLLFNPNRETSDQGPFNSWDREPFLNDDYTLTPKYNEIHDNFFICNYGSNMCIDNDDGSSYYKNHHNFAVYGGHKSDFGGHNKFTYNSIDAYSQDYQQGVCGEFNSVVPGYVDGYYDNKCVQGYMVPYLKFDECNINQPNNSTLPITGNNQVYNPTGVLSIQCGNTQVSQAEWQSKGFDRGTKGYPMPTDQEIMQWARDLLNIH